MRVSVSVPATSANLGPGFDVFGLALDLCNDVTLDTAATGVTWEGEGADELPVDGTDMVSRTIASIAQRMEAEVPAFGLHGHNRIPLERGLGSSSAAAVAGVVLAGRLLGVGFDGDPYSVFAAAAAIEGHPDNAAPAVYGGFTIALENGYVRRLEPHPALRPSVLVPPFRLRTDAARSVLSEAVARSDAIFNVGRAALMVEALTRDPDLLTVALDDRLHEEARLALLPQAADLVEELRRRHVPVCVSGAGPSLLVFEREEGGLPVALDAGWRVLRPGARPTGFVVRDA
jgi:homoserine kinase